MLKLRDKKVNLRKLNRLGKLYGYLLVSGNSPYYWHLWTEYEQLKKELI